MKIIKQKDLKDCGACSLQSIIMHYNGYVSLEKIRLDTYTNKDGVNAFNLIKAARSYGFDSYAAKMDSKKLLKENIVLPVIAHLRLDNGLEHFVAVYKISKNKIVIMDPAKGKVIMKSNEFFRLWTNVFIFFHPQQKIIKYDKEKKLTNLFLDISKKEYKLIFKIIVVSILLTLVSIVSNYYFKVGLNAITNNLYINYFKIIILSFLVITIFKIIFQYLRNYFINHLNKNVDVHLFSNFINHIFNLPLNIVQSRSLGEIVTRVSELNDLKMLFTDLFIAMFLDSILALSSMILLLIISKELFFILCIALILYLIIGIIFNKFNYQKIMCNIESETDFNTTLIENLNMITSIKNLNTTSKNLAFIEKFLIKYLKNNFDLNHFLNKQNLIKNFINEITMFFVNTVGFCLIKNNSISIVDLITFNSLMFFYLDPIKSTIDALPKISFLKASFYKLNDFLANNIENMTHINQNIFNNNIDIKNVSYSYNGYIDIIKNLNFSVKSSEHVFLKGRSGSGKSTICKLIYGMIRESSGNILIGGVSISDYSLDTIRNDICYVSQNESVYTDTIKQNIIFNRDIKLSEFNKVCKICNLESLIANKPLRYESVISDDTNFLSGGEKQRIILARALLKESKILLLDEALSEVDFKMESKIIKNILKAYKNKTIIYISHKDHARLFDRTIFLKGIHE